MGPSWKRRIKSQGLRAAADNSPGYNGTIHDELTEAVLVCSGSKLNSVRVQAWSGRGT